MEIPMKITKNVNAETLSLCLKVSDRFTADLVSDDGARLFSQDDGYVPGFMPGDHYGDYVMLDIDIDTGQVTNWKKPSAQEIMDWIEPEDD